MTLRKTVGVRVGKVMKGFPRGSNNQALGVLVVVIMGQILGKYMVIMYLDPWGTLFNLNV